jgi:hypothetical protein
MLKCGANLTQEKQKPNDIYQVFIRIYHYQYTLYINNHLNTHNIFHFVMKINIIPIVLT